MEVKTDFLECERKHPELFLRTSYCFVSGKDW